MSAGSLAFVDHYDRYALASTAASPTKALCRGLDLAVVASVGVPRAFHASAATSTVPSSGNAAGAAALRFVRDVLPRPK